MDSIITIIRFPVGIFLSAFLILFYISLFIIETLLLMLLIIPYALLTSRQAFQSSWIASYPNTIRALPDSIERLWTWVMDDEKSGYPGCLFMIIIIIFIIYWSELYTYLE